MSENKPKEKKGVVSPYSGINLEKDGCYYLANVLEGEVEAVTQDSCDDYDHPHYRLNFAQIKKNGFLFYDRESAEKLVGKAIKQNRKEVFEGMLFPLENIEDIKEESVWAVVDYSDGEVDWIRKWLIKKNPSLLENFDCFNTKEEAEAFIDQHLKGLQEGKYNSDSI